MNKLAELSLKTCDKHSAVLNSYEIKQLLIELPQWSLNTHDGVKRISREFIFNNFNSALSFTNLIGDIAEHENHHPLICIAWGKASVSWWTHSIAGLFTNDFIMAARCDVIYSKHSS